MASEGLSSKERSSGAIVQYVGQAVSTSRSLDLLAIVSFVAAQSLTDTKEEYAKQERRFMYIFGGFVCSTCVQDYVSLFCILLWPAFDQSSGWAKRLVIYRCRKGPPVHTSKRSFIQRTPTSKAANSKDFVFQIFSLIEAFHDKPK